MTSRPFRRVGRWVALLPLFASLFWVLHLASHLDAAPDANPDGVCLVCLASHGGDAPLPYQPPLLAAVSHGIAPSTVPPVSWRDAPRPSPRQGAPPRA